MKKLRICYAAFCLLAAITLAGCAATPVPENATEERYIVLKEWAKNREVISDIRIQARKLYEARLLDASQMTDITQSLETATTLSHPDYDFYGDTPIAACANVVNRLECAQILIDKARKAALAAENKS